MASWRQSPVVGIVGGIILIACIAAIIVLLQPKKTLMLLKCEECNTEFEMKVTPKTDYPIACSKCNKIAVYPAKRVQCLKCGWVGTIIEKTVKPLSVEQARALKEGEKGPGFKIEIPKCPKCGSHELKSIK